MLITRETDYALRILRALQDDRWEKAADLSQRECIPKQFTYKILKKLERGGMVEIRPGLGGGCRLAGDLSRFHLLDLIESMGDCVMVNACSACGYECSWRQEHGNCPAHAKLMELQKHFEEEMRAVSLDQLCMPSDGSSPKSLKQVKGKRKKKEESET